MITRECDVENSVDFSRYYASSFVGWHGREEGKIVPAYVGVTNGEKILLKFLSYKNETPSLTDWEGYSLPELREKIDFGRPRLGAMEDGPTVVFLSQTTPREPRKGLRIREAYVHEFNSWELRNAVNKSNPYNERYDWIWKAFNPEFTAFKEGFRQLSKGERVGVAVSRDIALYTVPSTPYPILAFKRWTIGYARTSTLIYLHSAFVDYKKELHNKTGAEVLTI